MLPSRQLTRWTAPSGDDCAKVFLDRACRRRLPRALHLLVEAVRLGHELDFFHYCANSLQRTRRCQTPGCDEMIHHHYTVGIPPLAMADAHSLDTSKELQRPPPFVEIARSGCCERTSVAAVIAQCCRAVTGSR